MPHLVEAGYLSGERPKADCCTIRQRTLNFRLRLIFKLQVLTQSRAADGYSNF